MRLLKRLERWKLCFFGPWRGKLLCCDARSEGLHFMLPSLDFVLSPFSLFDAWKLRITSFIRVFESFQLTSSVAWVRKIPWSTFYRNYISRPTKCLKLNVTRFIGKYKIIVTKETVEEKDMHLVKSINCFLWSGIHLFCASLHTIALWQSV